MSGFLIWTRCYQQSFDANDGGFRRARTGRKIRSMRLIAPSRLVLGIAPNHWSSGYTALVKEGQTWIFPCFQMTCSACYPAWDSRPFLTTGDQAWANVLAVQTQTPFGGQDNASTLQRASIDTYLVNHPWRYDKGRIYLAGVSNGGWSGARKRTKTRCA